MSSNCITRGFDDEDCHKGCVEDKYHTNKPFRQHSVGTCEKTNKCSCEVGEGCRSYKYDVLWTFDLRDKMEFNMIAPSNIVIKDFEVLNGISPVHITVDGVNYIYGYNIDKGQEVHISVLSPSVINFNVRGV